MTNHIDLGTVLKQTLSASLYSNLVTRPTGAAVRTQIEVLVADTLLTGRDDNGDGIFNDRPVGVGRNTLRGAAQTTVNMFLAYQFAFGQTAALPPGIGVFGGGNSATVRSERSSMPE